MTKPIILAPAGGVAAVTAAVRCGADAVYLGAKNFNARRNAENFDDLALPETVKFCHERGTKVFVTVNTLVTDGEMDALIEEADAIAETGAKAIQLHTGGMCHLDAEMTRQGLAGLGTGGLDLVILENVGNLVCPAEFDTGAVKNAMILSVPEGHDKPLKYPLMFQVCDVVLVNKIDVLPYFDFNMDKCREYVALRNPNARVIPICARTGEGIDEWADWLKEQVRAWQA